MLIAALLIGLAASLHLSHLDLERHANDPDWRGPP
jgi:hypothetical protein